MSQEPDREPFDDGDSEAGIRQQLAALDGDLMRGMPPDDRLSSGVPDGQRSNSLDFIQMTGLTRPPLPADSPDDTDSVTSDPVLADGDVDAPLSFYEQGIADVDESMGGGELRSGLRDINLDSDLIPNRGPETLAPGPSPSTKAFEDIISNLEQRAIRPQENEADAEQPVETSLQAPADNDTLDHEDYPAEEGSVAVVIPAESIEAEPVEHEYEHENTYRPADQDSTTIDPPATAPVEQDDFDALIASLASEETTEHVEEADTEDVTEDWDRLLDDDDRSAPSPPTPKLDLKPRGSDALAEAEQLMQALGTPRPAAAAPVSPGLIPTGSVSVFTPAPGPDLPPTPNFGAGPPRRRSRRPSRISRKSRRLVKVIFLALVFGTAMTSAWYFVLVPALEQPVDLEARAERLMVERKYRDASVAYSQLARHMSPGQPEFPNIQFRTAYALTLGPEVTMDDTRNRYEKAIDLFNTFVERYPQHPKRTRAQCIVGRLHYQLQDYEQAISVLRDQIKPVDDPAAALTILRYLARSYAQTGKYEEAETSYLQAATLPDNYSAETDYLELGDLFGKRAGLAEDSAKRKTLEDAAMAYWNRALQVPGIDPTDADILKQRLEWRSFAAESGMDTTSPENQPAVAEDETTTLPVPEGPTAMVPPVTPAPGDGDWVEDPAADIGVLLPSAAIDVAGPNTDVPMAPAGSEIAGPETETASGPEN